VLAAALPIGVELIAAKLANPPSTSPVAVNSPFTVKSLKIPAVANTLPVVLIWPAVTVAALTLPVVLMKPV
jgi:hypothetical protein